MQYCLVPLGCQMNLSDSERIRTVLESMGFERTDDESRADLLGIVACSVRQKAIDKVYARIHKWNQWKNRRALLTFISGCILPSDREKLLRRFDLLFTINELPQLPDMIRQYGVVTPLAGVPQQSSGEEGIPPPGIDDQSTGYWHIRPTYSSSFEAYVPIQNGCDKFCTFCAVPYTRGREVSRPSGEILAEVERLVQHGYRSITLLGQNVNSYGQDRNSQEIGFAELLRRIGQLGRRFEEPFWLYFTSPHPHDMSDEVIDVIAEYPCLAKQIHLPLQSGDDRVLIRMNRNYRVSRYHRVVEKIRATIPQATLFTDIIVGFSGETEEQFQNTVAAMRELRFNMAYVAMYSPRPGAASSRWADDVPHEEKRRRLHLLSDVLHETSGRYNRSLLGTRHTVLVEGTDRKPGYLSGRTEGRLIVRFAGDAVIEGSHAEVCITEAAPLSLTGELIGVRRPAAVGGTR
ncbi:MAG: tRNA (N6-isopentenyl adenosine(37)-C2)-methylthiotransferase MiaB [Spirochaetaceae bacterium]|nr:MAG: tRNA (N6-isopentenyl adenosine(37)-C2)-methylthiotransferase MiaB [Spirochaetaceae bacterium]